MDLTRKIDELRARRVQLRKAIRHWGGGMAGDPLDARRAMELCALELRSTEREWQELHRQLDMQDELRSLRVELHRARSAPVRAKPARSRATAPYLTRAMGSR